MKLLTFRVIVYYLMILAVGTACSDKQVDFNSEVKPIINKRCIHCHGGVKRNGDFSLLFRKDALDTIGSGKLAIVPGHPNQSEMIRRLTLNDLEERMPFKEPELPKEEIEILRKWIKQGAPWGDHWAYLPPQPVMVPSVESDESFINNEIDQFVINRLENTPLSPSTKADKATLLRRLYLDLIGIPPGMEDMKAFIQNSNSNAYEIMVDGLLESPKFGEKWASWWLDLARYADTKGYERDVGRTIWRYRDWVIDAFNKDLGLDQFTIEQLAGDLLPEPTDEQIIATAFHRNTMSNDEGGTEDEEFRVAAVIDRLNTTMEVWQSTTFGCVQCHSHPYDPFRHQEYYNMLAFFNNTSDEDLTGEYPNLRFYEEMDGEKIERILKWIESKSGDAAKQKISTFIKTEEPRYHAHDFDHFVNGELIDTKWLGIRNKGSARLSRVNLKGKKNLFISFWNSRPGGVMEVRVNSNQGKKIVQWEIPNTNNKKKVIVVPVDPVNEIKDLYFNFFNKRIDQDAPVATIEWLAFRNNLEGLSSLENAKLNQEILGFLNSTVEMLPVLTENSESHFRPTYIFERGNRLATLDQVFPEIPDYLGNLGNSGRNDRLDLARWMTSDENPLTARTFVNRIWDQLFGQGIVSTLEDFGTQGALPTHPLLLDWLALKLRDDYHWSMKKLIKLMVMSATYQQNSVSDPLQLELDPRNKYLSRGPRFRLSAEQIRDQALAVSGLLSDKMYGPGVMPPQPEGVWQTIYNSSKWETSEGEDRYRRGLYTYIKRTSPYPSMIMFDGSSREVCLSKRIRTNTPLQSLVTLNDPVYVEAAQHLAKIMLQAADEPVAQIKHGYSRALLKDIAEAKLKRLIVLYNHSIDHFSQDNLGTKSIPTAFSEGPEYKMANDFVVPEVKKAAMEQVAMAILNLDEFLTKE